MRVQYASFVVPPYANSPEQEELNRFLRGNRVVDVRKELVQGENGPSWLFLVEYLDASPARDRAMGAPKIDYKEVLSPEDFAVFSKLRDLRKSVAEAQGLPIYAVFTNDQLATLAKNRPRNQADFKRVEGIGEGKFGKFGEQFLALLAELSGEASGPAF